MRNEEEKSKKEDYLNLFFNISELVDLVTGSTGIENFLQQAVDLIAGHFNVDVCSIYLFENATAKLILKATHGLNPDAVNKIVMSPGQGLVGHSFEQMCIICEGNASQNPKFEYFIEAKEEPFNSFLCLPIKKGMEQIGVMVFQHRDLDYFTPSDQRVIQTVVAQLANALENARLLMAISQGQTDLSQNEAIRFIKGDCASPGVAMGRVRRIQSNRNIILSQPDASENMYTVEDFGEALEKTKQELKTLQKEFVKKLPESASLIFTAHFMILKDKNFTGKMSELMENGIAPCDAVREVAKKYISIFSSSASAHLKEKALDIEDLAIRILYNFGKSSPKDDLQKGSIVVATEIYPSDILKLVSSGVRGIILNSAGITSHVTILARSLKIPLIIVNDNPLPEVFNTTLLLMDAQQGNIYVDPDPETIDLFKIQKRLESNADTIKMDSKTLTMDKERITLLANINLLGEIPLAKKLKAEGIGLYRTEFPFLIRNSFPSETEQFVIYKKLFDDFGDKGTITFRTLDAGGEKSLDYSDVPNEANPELGLRSIRFSLKYIDVFKTQIQAILRAATGRKEVRIMFPMISSLDEFYQAKKVLSHSMISMKKDGIKFNENIAVGLMIELPSVMDTIDEFARSADFFSIGTNDFVQYMLAADRSNKMVADYYTPTHPAVIRAIKRIVTAASTHGIDVSVCGEMAHDPHYIPFLLGAGVRTLSVDPSYLVNVQQTIMSIDTGRAEEHAARLLSQITISGAKSILDQWSYKG